MPRAYGVRIWNNSIIHAHTQNNQKEFIRWVEWNRSICILWFYILNREWKKKPIFDNSVREFRCEFFECVLTIFRTADYTRNTYIIRNSMTCIADKWYVDQMTVFGNTFTYITLYYTILYIRIIIVCVTPYVLTSSDPFYWKTSVVKLFFLSIFKPYPCTAVIRRSLHRAGKYRIHHI